MAGTTANGRSKASSGPRSPQVQVGPDPGAPDRARDRRHARIAASRQCELALPVARDSVDVLHGYVVSRRSVAAAQAAISAVRKRWPATAPRRASYALTMLTYFSFVSSAR